jgi:hypothetical protein
VFAYSDESTSTCLGLTCNKFYGIHWAINGFVDLNAYHNGLWLYELLATWMAPRIPSVTRRNGQVDFVFIDPEMTEAQGNGREKWRRWLGRVDGSIARAA